MALLHKGKLHAFTADKRAAARVPLPVCTRVIPSVARVAAGSFVCQAVAAAEPVEYKGDLLNKSYYPTSADASNTRKEWFVINAEGQTLGRLATLAATYIRGKHQGTYTPSMDMGAFVVVVNAEKVQVSGAKFDDKMYFNHVNGRPGSYRMESFKDLQRRLPERIIERAVKGMLPKAALGRKIRLHLKVFKGPSHDHTAQRPTDITHLISHFKPQDAAGAKLHEEMTKQRMEIRSKFQAEVQERIAKVKAAAGASS